MNLPEITEKSVKTVVDAMHQYEPADSEQAPQGSGLLFIFDSSVGASKKLWYCAPASSLRQLAQTDAYRYGFKSFGFIETPTVAEAERIWRLVIDHCTPSGQLP